jgi:hypothetical protein
MLALRITTRKIMVKTLQKNVYQGEKIEFPPLPILEVPALYLGAHGELFSYATLEKDGFAFTMTDVNIPPAKGPPAHMHHYVAEWFYAPEGGITLFAADTDHLDEKNTPSAERGTQVTVYLVPLQPGQVFWSPRHRVHGYFNRDKVDRRLKCIWKPYPDAPDFKPYNDGGTREFFEHVHVKVDDPNDLSSVTEKRRSHYIRESGKFAAPHSDHLFQFINRVSPEIPESLQHSENFDELLPMLEIVRACNSGDKSIICH